jgi:hypothetical protein
MWEDNESPLATPDDAVREYVWNVGKANKDTPWIVSPYDSIHKNPFFEGDFSQHPYPGDF